MPSSKQPPGSISTEELESAIEDPRIRSYLEGVFTMIRAMVGYSTSMNDFLAAELQKERPDRIAVNAILSENDAKMMDFLGSITDAHHLMSRTDGNPGLCNFSESLENICAKLKMLFEKSMEIETDIKPGIFAAIDRVTLEIAVSNFVEELIIFRKPPASIRISLEPLARAKTRQSAAKLVVAATAAAKYRVPGLSETAVSIRAPEFANFFMKDFIRKLSGNIRRKTTPAGLEITFAFQTLRTDTPLILAADNRFEFDNARYSPIAAKLGKYARRSRY
jgi:hypothetical protein